jgi:hypothetical protein
MAVAVEQAQRSTKTRGEAVAGILAAISVSHLLNDNDPVAHSWIYPIPKSSFVLIFADRPIAPTLQPTASPLQPVVDGTDRRSMPLAEAGWLADRPVAAVVAPHSGDPGRRRLHRDRSSIFHPESSRTRDGVGRQARLRAIAVSDRRQRRIVARSAAGRVRRRAARPGQPGVVRGDRPRGDGAAAAGRALVGASPAGGVASRAARRVGAAARTSAAASSARCWSSPC